MHIFITKKAFDTLFDTHFSQGLIGPKCLNMGLYATFKEILRVSRFTLKQILTQILLQEYLCSLYIAIGVETEEKILAISVNFCFKWLFLIAKLLDITGFLLF